MFLFLTVVQALVAAILVGVILVQKSEGGGLGVGGGSPSGLMSARGAADFLTRSTAVLATAFVILSIILAAMAVDQTTGRDIDTSLERNTAAPAPVQPADPLAGAANPGTVPAAGDQGAAAAPPPPADDPLSGAAAR